jgi:phosphate transport system permease protein
MAIETPMETDFGEVSRVRGVVFRYLLVGMAFTGIVVLAILLALTANDAFVPAAADTMWFVVFGLAFAAPTVLTVAYFLRRNPAASGFGVTTVFYLVGGVMFGGAVVVLFIDVIAPAVWFAHVLGFVVALALFAAYKRVRPSGGLIEQSVVFAVVFGYTLVGLPGYFHSLPEMLLTLPYLPTTWLMLVATVALPVAAATAAVVAGRHEDRTRGLLAGGLLLAASLVGAFAAPAVGVDAIAGVVLPAFVIAPVALYVEGAFINPERRDERPGIAVPLVVFGGLAVAGVLVRALDLTGPASWLDWQFLTSLPDPTPAAAGIYPALVGSVLLMLLVVILAFPTGVGAAVYLEEYAPDNRYTRFIQINISNLAGVPSVVYGLLGLGIFINMGGLNTGSILVGGATLALLILPIIIISAQEAIRSVPDSLRQAAYGMGATRWQTVRTVVLPRAMPGILTGTILAIGRALGEAAPLLMIAAPTTTFSVPSALSDATSAMPLIIFNWAFRPQADFRTHVVAAGVITLLVVLLTMNSIAILLRNRYQSEGQQ